jgi:hypothetical protein
MQAVKMETEVQGINIYYEIIGEGRPIVMLHGAMLTIVRW